MRAVAPCELLLERLDGMHEAFAFSLAAALVGGPKILDSIRPQAAYVAQIMAGGRTARDFFDARQRCGRGFDFSQASRRRPAPNRSATLAIVEARLRAERRTLVYVCAAGRVGRPRGRTACWAGVFFARCLGIVVALVAGPGRFPHLDLSEQGGRSLGRQLGGAKALRAVLVAAAGDGRLRCAAGNRLCANSGNVSRSHSQAPLFPKAR